MGGVVVVTSGEGEQVVEMTVDTRQRIKNVCSENRWGDKIFPYSILMKPHEIRGKMCIRDLHLYSGHACPLTNNPPTNLRSTTTDHDGACSSSNAFLRWDTRWMAVAASAPN